MATKNNLCKPLLALLVLALVVFIPICNAGSVLYSGNSLATGKSLENGNYRLTMQDDCNLVLYDNGVYVWATRTYGKYVDCTCTLTNEANLVVSTPDGTQVWASNSTREAAQYVLLLQEDRNLVIYGGGVWAAFSQVQGQNKGLNAVNANRWSRGAFYLTELNPTSMT